MLTGGSRDLTVRATHAPLERTNAVAPPSCPPAGRSGGENRARRNVRSHGTLGMWQQFPQQRSNENLRVRLIGDNWRQRLTQKARGVDEIAPRCIRRCQKNLQRCLRAVVRDRKAKSKKASIRGTPGSGPCIVFCGGGECGAVLEGWQPVRVTGWQKESQVRPRG